MVIAKGQRVVDRPFMSAVHRLPCVARGLAGHRCKGAIQAHHAGARSSGDNPHGQRKADDDTVIPLCERAHAGIEDLPRRQDGLANPFYTMSAGDRRVWQDAMIAETRVRVLLLLDQEVGGIDEELRW